MDNNRPVGPVELTIGIVVLLVLAFIGFGILSHSALYPKVTAQTTPAPTKTIQPSRLPPIGSIPPAPSYSPKPSITPISGCWTTSAGTRICANTSTPQ